MQHFVLRLWLSDRPGVLGKIATSIGDVGGDVEGIDILERGGGQAIDELVVALPDAVSTDALIANLSVIEGLGIEDVRMIEPGRPDAGTAALLSAAILVSSPVPQLLEHFCDQLCALVEAVWAVALDLESGTVLATRGVIPDVAWLGAFFAGSQHLSADDHNGSAPSDIVWTGLRPTNVAVAAGRSNRPFHFRERQRVALLGDVVGGLLGRAGVHR